MQVDYRFDGGTPCDIEMIDAVTTRCRPYAARTGSQWFYFSVRITDVPAGGGQLQLQWPRKMRPEEMPADASEEFKRRHLNHDSFATVLHRTCLIRTEQDDWRPWDQVEVDADGLATIRIPDGPDPIYLATQQPYLWSDWQALLDVVRAQAPRSLREIGRSRAGLPMYAICFDAEEAVGDAPPAIYLQAAQHVGEFSGPLVIDAMVRHLLSDAGRPLRRSIAFDFVPVVDLDRLHTGVIGRLDVLAGMPDRGNPNRLWGQMSWPELRNVDAFLHRQIEAGRTYRVGLDLHNGWSAATRSAACYTVADEQETSPAYVAGQKALIDHLYAHTDHTEPGRYWAHRAPGRFVDYFRELTGAFSFTVEFSRHLWWDRAAGEYVRPTPDHPRRFAVDALAALASYVELRRAELVDAA